MWVIKQLILLLCIPTLSFGMQLIAGTAGTAPDVTAPTISSVTVGTDGDTVTIVFTEAVTDGGLDGGEFDIDCDGDSGANNVLVYSSGDTTNTWVFTATSTVQSGETCDLDFDGDADEAEDGAGNDLADVTDGAVTNNSTQGTGATLYNLWAFENNLTDTQGNNNLSAGGGTTYGSTSPPAGTYFLDPDGTDDYWYVTDSGDMGPMEGDGDFSIAFWMKYSSPATKFIGKYDSSESDGWVIETDGTRKFIFYTDATVKTSGNYVFSNSEWMHFVVTYDAATNVVCLYRNGSLLDTGDFSSGCATAGDITTHSAEFSLCKREGYSSYSGAEIDDLRIYDGKLTSDEVSTLYGSY